MDEEESWPIILDDVVTSFDREHRGRLPLLLKEHFANRQVLLFTHERDWLSELRIFLPEASWAFATLREWSDPASGIAVTQARSGFEPARELLGVDHTAAGNRARGITDVWAAIVAERLELELPYLRGDRNDRRTGAELLPRLVSAAAKRLEVRSAGKYERWYDPPNAWKRTEEQLRAWGNPSSHGRYISLQDARTLVDACEQAWTSCRCGSCKEYFWNSVIDGKYRHCGCGGVRWKL
jgi:hypothetical protein